MKYLVAAIAMLGGVVSIGTGLEQLLQHLVAGDLLSDPNILKTSLGLLMAGAAAFSPGLQSLKVGVFARADQPSTQATATAVPTPPVPPAAVVGFLAFFLLLAPLSAHAFSRYDCKSPADWAKSNTVALGQVAEGLVTLGMMGTPTLVQLTSSEAGFMPATEGWGTFSFIGIAGSWLHGYVRLGGSLQGTIAMTAHLFCFDPFT